MDIRQVFASPPSSNASSAPKDPAPKNTAPQDAVTSDPAPQQTTSATDNVPRTTSVADDYLGTESAFVSEIDIVTWSAPSRVFKKRDRKYFTNVLVIVLLISLILFFAGQFLPIAVVLAVTFVTYILSTFPPEVIHNKITNYGVYLDEKIFYWDELGRFWFEKRMGQDVMFLETSLFPYRLLFVLTNTSVEEVRDVLQRVLLEEKPPLTTYEKAAEWMQKKFPLDLDGDSR